MRSSARAAPPAFHAPLVAGSGQGGALALDMLAQTPADTLGGAIAVDPAAAAAAEDRPLHQGRAHPAAGGGSSYALPAGAPPAPLTLAAERRRRRRRAPRAPTR